MSTIKPTAKLRNAIVGKGGLGGRAEGDRGIAKVLCKMTCSTLQSFELPGPSSDVEPWFQEGATIHTPGGSMQVLFTHFI